jgi:hypothetical protein
LRPYLKQNNNKRTEGVILVEAWVQTPVQERKKGRKAGREGGREGGREPNWDHEKSKCLGQHQES